MHCPLLHRSLRLRRRFRSSPVFADCQAHQIVTHQGLAVAPIELFKSMPCPLLNQSVPSTRATLPSSPVQSLRISVQFSNFALAVRVSAVRPPAPTAQDFAVLLFAPAVRIVAVPIRAVPSRCSAAHSCSVHPQFISTQSNTASPHSQPYQCSAVAPADHCVTVRARPSQCRSDHLMSPAFRITSGHNPCSVIPCKTAYPQSLRISRPRSHLSSLSRPLPWLISSASCCTLAPLFNVPLFNAIPSAMPSHAIPIHAIASRFAAVRISAFQRSLAALLCASRPLHCATPHSIAPHHPLPYQAHQSPALHLLSWA